MTKLIGNRMITVAITGMASHLKINKIKVTPQETAATVTGTRVSRCQFVAN